MSHKRRYTTLIFYSWIVMGLLVIILVALVMYQGIKEGWGQPFSGGIRLYLVERASREVCQAQLAFQHSANEKEAAKSWQKFLKADGHYRHWAQEYNTWINTVLKNGVELPAGLPIKVAEIAVKYACPD